MVAHDQLKEQQRLGAAFVNYREMEITFPPSYKVILARALLGHAVALALSGGGGAL
jgi:hypothetical protein